MNIRKTFARAGRLPRAASLLGAALLLGACLDTGSSPARDGDPVSEADALYRAGNFAAATAAYDAAIAGDSTRSQAYLGYAKARLAVDRLPLDSLRAAFLAAMQDTTRSFPLVLDLSSDTVLTRRLRALTAADRALAILADRDTLTAWHGYLALKSNPEDTAFAARRAWMQGYLNRSDAGEPGHRPRSGFPLSDRKIRWENVRSDAALVHSMRVLHRFYDFDSNGIIDFSSVDSLAVKLQLGSGGGFDSLMFDSTLTGIDPSLLDSLLAGPGGSGNP